MAENVSSETPTPYGDLWEYGKDEQRPYLWYLRTNGDGIDCWHPENQQWIPLIHSAEAWRALSTERGPWRRATPEAIGKAGARIGAGPHPTEPKSNPDRLVITVLKRKQ